MKITTRTTLAQFMSIAAILPVSEQVKEQIAAIGPPVEILGVKVPANLDGIKMGQLLELQAIKPSNSITEPARVLLGIERGRLLRCEAFKVIGFNNFTAGQMGSIAKRFGAIPSLTTAQERRAGADKLNFGIFGLIDAYAKRMGITNHDKVLDVKWLHIWQVLYNDARTVLYERRLRDVYAKTK